MGKWQWGEVLLTSMLRRRDCELTTVVMMSTPSRPADSYLGLLFCMEDMAL